MKSPPSPLCRGGPRGDFHINLEMILNLFVDEFLEFLAHLEKR